jgi:hypothetical protein
VISLEHHRWKEVIIYGFLDGYFSDLLPSSGGCCQSCQEIQINME